MTARPDIFLSYNREDQAVAKRFAEAFEAAGLSVWWDVTLRSGEAYDKVAAQFPWRLAMRCSPPEHTDSAADRLSRRHQHKCAMPADNFR
jgi:hypothetical protein